MKCIIVEDQAPAQRVLKKYISDLGELECVGVFSNALDARDFLKAEIVDLMFLDIHLPKMSGMDFLRTLINPPAVILTTAFTEYAVQSYEYNVVDYLVKPFSFERFVRAVNKAESHSGRAQRVGTSFFIKTGHEYVKVKSDEVSHIHSDMDYTELHVSQKIHVTPETLQHWEHELSDFGFVRVHKSYLLNTAHIEKIVGNTVHLKGGAEVPVGRAYKEDFLKRSLGR